MKLRIIVSTNDYTLAANIGGPNELTVRTFDVECPSDLASFVTLPKDAKFQFTSRWISGVELIEASGPSDERTSE